MKLPTDIMSAPIAVETIENTDGDVQLTKEQLDIQTETALQKQSNHIQMLTTYLGSGLLFISHSCLSSRMIGYGRLYSKVLI